MKRNMRVYMSIFWVVAGFVLLSLAFAGKVDEYWSGMGSALLVVGVLQLMRFRRFNKNESYREKVEIAESDERNHFIRNKAWAWTGYILLLALAVASIVFRILDQDLLSQAASYTVCLMLLIYWIVYAVLKRKY